MPYIPKGYNTTEQQIELLKFSIENLHNRIDKLKVEIEELKKIKESEEENER